MANLTDHHFTKNKKILGLFIEKETKALDRRQG